MYTFLGVSTVLTLCPLSLSVCFVRHDYLLNEDEMLKAALGTEYKIEQMRAGVLRLGGVPTSYAEHLLVTGDAAGMIDPMTGEGTVTFAPKKKNDERAALQYRLSAGSVFFSSHPVCSFSSLCRTCARNPPRDGRRSHGCPDVARVHSPGKLHP